MATSSFLRTTRDSALRTQGIHWTDEQETGSHDTLIAGRETRKMNMYQAVRDGLRSVAGSRLQIWDSPNTSMQQCVDEG